MIEPLKKINPECRLTPPSSAPDCKIYDEIGAVVVKNALTYAQAADILAAVLDVMNDHLQAEYSSLDDALLIDRLSNHPEDVGAIYDRCKTLKLLHEYAGISSVIDSVKALLGVSQVAVFDKKILRIDLPFVTKELAHWHQDYYYVRGATDAITAWIALTDVNWVDGCLSIMPGSHRLGVLDHSLRIGKRDIPRGIFQREIRYMEVNKGDMILFHNLLLHSSNLNLSDRIRFSLQYRYSEQDFPNDLSTDKTALV